VRRRKDRDDREYDDEREEDYDEEFEEGSEEEYDDEYDFKASASIVLRLFGRNCIQCLN